MNLSGFLDTLRKAGLETYVEDILDGFWLAGHLEGQSFYKPSEGPGQPAAPTEPAPQAERQKRERASPSLLPAAERLPLQPRPQETPIYPLGRTEASRGRRASILSVPAARVLPNRLPLARALRPFTRRWRSTTSVEVDEEETVDATASLGFFHPVVRPAPERWYSVDVVVEDDPAVDVWRPMLREFCRVLQNTGAFQDVRQWQLRLRPPKSDSARFGVMLETPEGAGISPQFVAGTGTRRLILFATHGCSVHWSDGAYKQVLEAWLPTATVALLHVLPNDRWKRTALGGEQGICHTARPGLASSLLDAEPFWWAVPAEEDALFLPIVSLEARDVARFADMQMGRGRSAPIVFLDSSRAEAAGELGGAEDVERIIAALKAESPDAFRLAFYLCSGPFTLPVARLIQEVKLGSDSTQSALGDILLSGLVLVRSAEGQRSRPEEVLYEFRPEARAILMQSLRRSEAELLAHELKDEVSRYIGAVSDRAEKFAVQFPDEMGTHRLPGWLRSFAWVMHSLRGEPVTWVDALSLVQQFRARVSVHVLREAVEISRRFAELPFDRTAVDEEVFRTLAGHGLVRQDRGGQWRFCAGVAEALDSLAALPDLSERLQQCLNQINVLGAWKELHDHLHELERCVPEFEQVAEGKRIEMDIASTRLRFRLHKLLIAAKDIRDRSIVPLAEIAWLVDEVERADEFSYALQRSNWEVMRNAVSYIRRLLIWAPRINDQIVRAYRILNLGGLIGEMRKWSGQNSELASLLREKLQKFEHLDKELSTLIVAHDTWQRFDLELRRAEDSLAHSSTDLGAFTTAWAIVRRRSASVYANSHEDEEELQHCGAEIDQALTNQDWTRVHVSFSHYKAIASFRFFKIDRMIIGLVEDLKQVIAPLASVLTHSAT
jgi:hypothetical protein